MTSPDFDRMTKDEVIAWVDVTDDVSPLLAGLSPAVAPVGAPAPDGPMMLASIRLPVAMVEHLDSLADLDGTRRSDVIRQALAAYLTDRTAPVSRDDAHRALAVLRRVVDGTPPASAAAA